MRDAVGGTFMMYVFIIFLTVYICFVAVAFNYARAFRVKNKVIDIIEQNEGMDFVNESGVIGDINTYLGTVNYNINGLTATNCPDYVEGNDNHYFGGKGYCVSRISATSDIDGGLASYYKVTTFVRLEIPFIEWFSFTIPVSGETRKVEEKVNT